MKVLSVALLAIASAQLVASRMLVSEPCNACQQPTQYVVQQQPQQFFQSQPQMIYNPQPQQNSVYIVEDPSRQVLLLEEPAKELVLVESCPDEPSALERILRILRKTGVAVRRVGDILARDAGDELGLEDCGCGSASAVAHTVINLGHPYTGFPAQEEEIIVVEPPCEETVIMPVAQQMPIQMPTPVYPVVQQPCATPVQVVQQQPQQVQVTPQQQIQVVPQQYYTQQYVPQQVERCPCETDVPYLRQAMPTKYTNAIRY